MYLLLFILTAVLPMFNLLMNLMKFFNLRLGPFKLVSAFKSFSNDTIICFFYLNSDQGASKNVEVYRQNSYCWNETIYVRHNGFNQFESYLHIMQNDIVLWDTKTCISYKTRRQKAVNQYWRSRSAPASKQKINLSCNVSIYSKSYLIMCASVVIGG